MSVPITRPWLNMYDRPSVACPLPHPASMARLRRLLPKMAPACEQNKRVRRHVVRRAVVAFEAGGNSALVYVSKCLVEQREQLGGVCGSMCRIGTHLLGVDKEVGGSFGCVRAKLVPRLCISSGSASGVHRDSANTTRCCCCCCCCATTGTPRNQAATSHCSY